MEQEELRCKLIEHCNSRGVKYSFIATKLNVNKSTISRFKDNKKVLGKELYNQLKKYLEMEM